MDKKQSLSESHKKHKDENWTTTNWRAWGSWFSWGSPVGLGLFFLAVAGTIWILAHL